MAKSNPIEIELKNAEVLQIQPGDVVVVTAAKPITQDAVHAITAAIQGKLGEHMPVMVLDDDLKLSLLRGYEPPAPEVL